MFKSIYTRYIAFISLLITFSFLLLVITVTVMITEYSVKTKKDLMNKTADSVVQAVDTYFRYTGSSEMTGLISDDINGIAEISDTLVYVVDEKGKLIVTNDESFQAGSILFGETVIANIIANSQSYAVSRIENTFETARLNIFRVLDSENSDTMNGIVLVSSLSTRDTALSGPMVRTLLVASVWILLASCLTVYILLQRIVDPLKNISESAKAFAKGNFGVRIKESGNDEIGDVAKAFNNMAMVLEKNEELRNSFIGSVSHDLRTPMTVIQGYVDGILDGTIPREKQDYYLGIISSETKRLSRLVSSLLMLSRIQSGEQKLNMTNFNVSEKARQILLSFEKRIDEKKLEVEFDCEKDLTVRADTDAIHQVIYNLMDNAVKFVNEKGTLSVAITERGKKAHISIKNTGEGIPAEELPHIFDRFYKSDRSRGLDKTGTGLGLFIAKTNVNRHDEELTVKSTVGEYTEFEFDLPLA